MSIAPSAYFGLIGQIIRTAPDVATGARVLHEIARQFVPPELPVWKVLAALKWADDVAAVREAWVERARTCIPPEASGIYFGIDGLNMPEGKGVELGCSSGHLPGWQSIDYVFNCETYCPDLPLPSLTALYTWLHAGGGYDTFGPVDNLHVEYPICLGVSALVFRDALRGVDAWSLVGETTERCFAIGFHDGDLLRLGRGTLTGFVNDASFDCW
ncbi:MAG TPA: hypothetical protein VGR35_03770 [Tepidisphaeraceae bacterium]|nr:hypothetical protein [Tepidisphaeraceae bacterium]